VAGSIYSNDVHYFDMRLALRAPDSRGRLADLHVDTQPLGEVIFVPAGHRYVAGGGPGIQRNFFLFLNADCDPQMHSTAIAAAPLRPRDCMNLRSERIKMLLTRICRELYDPGFATTLLLEGLGTTLQAETLRLLHHDREREQGKGGLSPVHMRRIRETVVEGNSLPSLAHIATMCGMSRRHLMRAFRQETGQTVGEYVKQLAMDKARQLLEDTDQPVNAIASSVGFSSAAAFSTAFKRATGDSPRNYRTIQRASMISHRRARP
jgi:AraC family transcriptional regulator